MYAFTPKNRQIPTPISKRKVIMKMPSSARSLHFKNLRKSAFNATVNTAERIKITAEINTFCVMPSWGIGIGKR